MAGKGGYKQWTKAERDRSYRLTRLAILTGVIPPPSRCNRCGQAEGLIHYHNHDYSDPIKYLEQLCWRCHMVLHCEHRAPDACAAYWEAIRDGFRWAPVHKHNFGILWRDHGIR